MWLGWYCILDRADMSLWSVKVLIFVGFQFVWISLVTNSTKYNIRRNKNKSLLLIFAKYVNTNLEIHEPRRFRQTTEISIHD
jgi:membrane-associated HD superfamily phosphohydrolase